MPEPDRPLTPGDVASLFNVSITTVAEWANNGKLRSFKTPGGHRRFKRADVDDLLAKGGNGQEAAS